MTTTRRKKKDDGKNEFFLYVAFHSAFSAIFNLFKDD
tara:strand:+ start:1351 stop:1461 length:111 start_codon:yes stop_codon:yes gene_type:complete